MIIGDIDSQKKEESISVNPYGGMGNKPEQREQEFATILGEAIDNGVTTINPDMIYSNLVKNFSQAKKLYGKTFLRMITGFDPNTIEINLNIKEFRDQLRSNIHKNVDELIDKGLIDNSYSISDKALEELAITYLEEELDKLSLMNIEGSIGKRKGYQVVKDIKQYSVDSTYKDLDVRKTLKVSSRRMHKSIDVSDLRLKERKERKGLELVLLIDTSASMKGVKIRNAKKAAIALISIAINNKHKVGLIAFSSNVRLMIPPTLDKKRLINELLRINPIGQTNIRDAVIRANELFHRSKAKHLVLITDALPNVGDQPSKEVLDAISLMKEKGITTSIVGIGLNDDGRVLAERISLAGNGRFYDLKDSKELDFVLISDYLSEV